MENNKSINDKKELAAKRELLEELFYDVYPNRGRIYRINLIRGIFFGVGSILGGTVVVAIAAWILSQIGNWFPFISDVTRGVVDTIQ